MNHGDGGMDHGGDGGMDHGGGMGKGGMCSMNMLWQVYPPSPDQYCLYIESL